MLFLVRRHRRALALPFSTLQAAAPASSPTPPSSLDAAAVLQTLSLYTNDWRRALDFFHWSASPAGANLPPTAATLARAVDILGKHFEFPLATSLILSHHDPARRDPAFLRPALRALLNRLAAANLVDDAVRPLKGGGGVLGAAGGVPRVLQSVVRRQVRQGAVAEGRLCRPLAQVPLLP